MRFPILPLLSSFAIATLLSCSAADGANASDADAVGLTPEAVGFGAHCRHHSSEALLELDPSPYTLSGKLPFESRLGLWVIDLGGPDEIGLVQPTSLPPSTIDTSHWTNVYGLFHMMTPGDRDVTFSVAFLDADEDATLSCTWETHVDTGTIHRISYAVAADYPSDPSVKGPEREWVECDTSTSDAALAKGDPHTGKSVWISVERESHEDFDGIRAQLGPHSSCEERHEFLEGLCPGASHHFAWTNPAEEQPYDEAALAEEDCREYLFYDEPGVAFSAYYWARKLQEASLLSKVETALEGGGRGSALLSALRRRKGLAERAPLHPPPGQDLDPASLPHVIPAMHQHSRSLLVSDQASPVLQSLQAGLADGLGALELDGDLVEAALEHEIDLVAVGVAPEAQLVLLAAVQGALDKLGDHKGLEDGAAGRVELQIARLADAQQVCRSVIQKPICTPATRRTNEPPLWRACGVCARSPHKTLLWRSGRGGGIPARRHRIQAIPRLGTLVALFLGVELTVWKRRIP